MYSFLVSHFHVGDCRWIGGGIACGVDSHINGIDKTFIGCYVKTGIAVEHLAMDFRVDLTAYLSIRAAPAA